MNLRALFLPLLLAAFALAPAGARADNDAVQFGSDINISSTHPIHDAVCFFCSVHVQGEVTGDIVVFFGGVQIDGKANRDVVNFFGRTRLADDSIVGRDLVNFFGSVRAGENVQIGRSLVVLLGDLRAPQSLSVGKDRVVQPAWLLWIPLIIFALIVIAIVSLIRNWQRRRMYAYYQAPPHP